MEAKKAAVEGGLTDNLEKRLASLEDDLMAMDLESRRAELEINERKLEAARLEVSEAERARKGPELFPMLFCIEGFFY